MIKPSPKRWILRPGIENPLFWYPQRFKRPDWRKLRQRVLEAHNWRCLCCKHRALKWMNIHHIGRGSDHSIRNLAPVCVACHALLHIGFNLQHGVIEIWQSDFSQLQVVRLTRAGIKRGISLRAIKRTLHLRRGPLPPRSVEYANNLISGIGRAPRASLPLPLVAVFVRLQRWQLE